MAIENIPVWTFPPDWQNEVREVLAWMTNVLVTPTAAEQRRALRDYPRRTFEYGITLAGIERALFENFVRAHGGRDFYAPTWQETHWLESAIAAGTTFLPCLSANTGGFSIGEVIFIGAGYPQDFELAEISGLSNLGITVTTPLTKNWTTVSRVHPVSKSQLTTQPRMRRLDDQTSSAQVRLAVVEEFDNIYNAPAVLITEDSYLGFHVLSEAPDEREPLNYDHERQFDELDNETSIPIRRDLTGFSSTRQQFVWVLRGRVALQKFVKLMHHLKGRYVPLWLPTFFADFQLAQSAVSGSTAIIVADCGFTATGGPNVGREHICIFLTDGTRLYRKITSSVIATGDRESLGLDLALPLDIDVNLVLRISYMALCRLDQDQVEIAHVTDNEGLAEVNTTFRAVPNIRQELSGF